VHAVLSPAPVTGKSPPAMPLKPTVPRWPAGDGGLSALIRESDWAATPLGPSGSWPQSLRTAIDLMLGAHAEIVLFWGPDYIAFYNDAYAPTIGNKHPHALGRPAIEHWAELWDDLEPLLRGVRQTGQTFSARDRPFQIDRSGFLEQVYFDISYSAVRDEYGDVAGVMCIVSETTARVLAAQALATSEAALRKEKEFTRLLLDSTSEGFYAVDRSGATTLCNAAFLRMLGYGSAEELLGRKLHAEIHHSHADGSPYLESASPILQAALNGTAATVAGEVFFRKDGSRLLLDYRVEPMRRNGVLEGAICTFADRSARLLGQELQAVRQKAENELRETHEQLRLAEAAGGVGLFLIDLASNNITASAEFCRLFGLPALGSFSASLVEQLFEPDTVEVTSNENSRRSGEAPLNVEYRIRRADSGEPRWISRRAEFVRDASGRPVWMRGAVQDVTERKLAETTVRESESRFRVLAQAIPNQVWTAGPDGKLDWLNQKVYDYSGREEAELLGDGWALLVHAGDLPRVGAEWQRSVDTGQRYETEFRVRRHDGVYRWHLVRALPLAVDGQIRWLGTNTDIEDQKSLQEALADLNVSLERRVEERTRDRDRMWRLSTDLIVVADFGNMIKAANPAWQSLLGWSEDELIGSSFMMLVHQDDRQRSAAESDRLSNGIITQRFENRLRHKDGSYRTISWIAVPDQGLVHAVGRDISAERDAAQVLHETEERLRQSQKMEALGQLTGGIAHDFNNLLQGISGSLDVVRRRIANGRGEDVERFMESATQSTHRAAALIHRLLAFARRQSLDSKPVDISLLVSSMEELLRRTLGEHMALMVAAGQGVWPVLSDENQLESAILNLAINARDAMPHGGSLSITTSNATLDESYTRLHEGLLPGDYALLSVTDTGAGMSADVLSKVFEPFFTTKPIGQGTGLGLSMIYGFAKQSGGHVRIRSEPGHGTSVQLYLPRHGVAALLPDEPVAGAAAQPGEGQTILVVEDDPAVRLIVLDELGELGYLTLEAIDGPSALPILKSARKIDLLLSDVGLPGMNGRQIAEIARQHRPGLPVLFMTGYAENAAARSEFLAPGMEMISKPFAMDDLAAMVGQILAPASRTDST
jgi:PAS domain S-box-containing protein